MALVEFARTSCEQSRPKVLRAETLALEPDLSERIFRLMSPDESSIELLGETDRLLGIAIGEAIGSFLNSGEIDPQSVTAIGCHGQTVRHRPAAGGQFTLQIGDPNCIAEIVGRPVVADFRRRDMAAGGQGAPLVPAYHELLFRSADEYRVVLNIGGIANITCLPPSTEDTRITGFDTGPGNALLDAWIRARLGHKQDTCGAWAQGQAPHAGLLSRLLSDPYFAEPPPKSTGREYFHPDWLGHAMTGMTIDAQVVQSTLTELTACSIINAVRQWAPRATRMILCGGGRHNSELVKRLRQRSELVIEPCEQLGVDGDFVEAAAFAWFAMCTLAGIPSSRASVTGAVADRVLGGVYYP